MWKIIVGLIICIISNIFLGMALSNLNKKFDKKAFKIGIKKAVYVFIGSGLLLAGSFFVPNIMVINIGGLNVNLIDGMKSIFTAGIVLYGSQSLNKLIKILNVKVDAKEVQEKETIPVPKENEIRVTK